MSDCLTENTIAALLDGRADPGCRDRMSRHIAECAPCRSLVAALAPGRPERGPAASDTAHQSTSPDPGLPHTEASLAFAIGEVAADRYRILRFLAQGGMGQVYLAHDLELRIDVALKALLPHISADAQALARFKREVLLARRVSHDNVCRIFDLGLHRRPGPMGEQTIHFLTMELLHGCTLAQRLRERGLLAPAEALPLVRQMALALDAAHRQGVVHRDFKPDNVFLVPTASGTERLVVTDFGLARTSAGQEGGDASLSAKRALVGTPAYMAPEQVEGKPLGPAADIYALGVVIYEMVTGARPFGGDTPLAVAIRRLTMTPASPRAHRPDLDVRWERTILRCLAKEPAARFGSALEVRRELETRPTLRSIGARFGLPAALTILPCLLVLLGPLARPSWWRHRDMVLVPGGPFTVGSSPEEVEAALLFCRQFEGDNCPRELYEREEPRHQVRLSPYYLDAMEVTNEQFAAWLNRLPGLVIKHYDGSPGSPAGSQGADVHDGTSILINLVPYYGSQGIKVQAGRFTALRGFERKPVTAVTWEGASRYCQSQNRRLPTEAEWERAARGTAGNRFPWGDEEPTCDGVVHSRRDKSQRCAILGSGPLNVGQARQDRTELGIVDLGGNVMEWVEDVFRPYQDCHGECRDPVVRAISVAEGDRDLRVVRGGSWYQSAESCRAAERARLRHDTRSGDIGFRCAETVR